MAARGMSLLLGLVGIAAGIALQFLVGARLDNVGLFFISLAGALALIAPVVTAMPARKEKMMSSPKSRKIGYVFVVLSLLLAWIVLVTVAVVNGLAFPSVLAGLALLSLTTCVWVAFIQMTLGKASSGGARVS